MSFNEEEERYYGLWFWIYRELHEYVWNVNITETMINRIGEWE